jgi:DNA-binding MarR family transcriptional regulator
VTETAFSDGDYRSLAEFRYQLRRFLAFSEQEARRFGLNPQQHQMLLAVRAADPATATIGFLAKRVVLKHHSVVELVNRLERRGFVSRQRAAEDRRRVLVQLTARGDRALRSLTIAHRAEIRRAAPKLVAALQRTSRRRGLVRRFARIAQSS